MPRGAALASDSFNRANGGLGASWTSVTGRDDLAIVSNQVQDSVSAGGTVAAQVYSAVAAPDDQWVQITIIAITTSSTRSVGLLARFDETADSGYRLRIQGPLGSSAVAELVRVDAGVTTVLASPTITVAANDTASIECEGTSIRAFINLAQVASVTDATYASGQWGAVARVPGGASLADAILDTWSAGGFTAPPASERSYHVGAEWVAGSYTNLTADTVRASIVRQMATLFTGITPSELTIELLNISGKYNPDNAAGPFAGLITPGKRVRVLGFAPNDPATRQLFQGYLDEVAISGNDVNNQRAIFGCRDIVREFRHRTINTSLYVNWNTASLFSIVLSAAGVSSISVDLLTDNAPLTWFRDEQAESAIDELIRLGFYRAWVQPDGIFRVANRYYDQAIGTVANLNQFLAIGYSRNDDSVLNDVVLESAPRQSASVATLAYITGEISIANSTGVAFVMEYQDPNSSRSVPGTDLTFSNASLPLDFEVSNQQGAQNTALSQTCSASAMFFGETVVCSVFNASGSPGFLWKCQVQGRPVPEAPRLSVATRQVSSQNVFGRRSLFLSSDGLGGRNFLADYGGFLVDRYKDPIPRVDITLRNEYPAILSASIGDRIHVVNSALSINSSHIVMRLEHDIAIAEGIEHTMTMELERIVLYSLFTLNHSDLGELDSGNVLAF